MYSTAFIYQYIYYCCTMIKTINNTYSHSYGMYGYNSNKQTEIDAAMHMQRTGKLLQILCIIVVQPDNMYHACTRKLGDPSRQRRKKSRMRRY